VSAAPLECGRCCAGRLLKEKQGASALVRFERALMLAKFVGDQTQERRATRGLAAAARLQARPPPARVATWTLRMRTVWTCCLIAFATRPRRLHRKSLWSRSSVAPLARKAASLLASPCTNPCPMPHAPCPMPHAPWPVPMPQTLHALRQGQHRTAIQHLQRVLEISGAMGDHVGDADAYGTIADIYTEIGHFERAAEFYDKYIERMSADGPV